MIYNIKIIIEINKKNIWNNFYKILWSIYDILWKNNELNYLKDSILSVSNIYRISSELSAINISINWKENFNQIITIIQNKKEINLNWNIYKINWIDFNFNIFDDNLKYIDFNQVEVSFKTPTIIKKEINWIDINQLMPIPEVFLVSAIRKYNKLYSKNFNIDEIKKEIKNNVIVVKFDILTKTVVIKNNIKAWVVWKIKYEFLKWINSDVKIIVYNALKLASIIWLWTWVKLWLWQVWIYFINK